MTTTRKVQIRELLQNKVIKYRPSQDSSLAPEALIKMSPEEIATMHPADLAELLNELPLPVQIQIVRLMGEEQAAEVLMELEDEQQLLIARGLELKSLTQILENMPADETVDLLGQFSQQKIDELLSLMEEEDRNETIEFLCYAEDSAGRAMAKELVDFYPETTVAQALDLLRRKFDREDFFSYLYITSHEQELLGIVSLKELILAPAHATMEELMQTSVVTVNLDDDQEKAAYLATRYDLSAIPVINEERHLMGIITGEDINEIIEEEYEEDLFKMAGLGEEQESFSQNPLKAAIYRFPWLITTVCGGLLSAWIIEHLRSAEYIWLLSFSPLILGLAGNIGIQTSTIIIRELSQSQFSKHLSARYFFTEIFTGCCLALFCGLTVGVIVSALRGSVLQGITVGLSLFSVIILSTCTSVCTPLIFNKLKIDPAIASGPLVTTMIDVCGLFIYFHCSYALLSNFIGT